MVTVSWFHSMPEWRMGVVCHDISLRLRLDTGNMADRSPCILQASCMRCCIPQTIQRVRVGLPTILSPSGGLTAESTFEML